MRLFRIWSSVATRGFGALVIAFALAGAGGSKVEAFTTTQAGYVCVDSDESSTATVFPPAFSWDEIGGTGIVVGAWSFDNATTFFGVGNPPFPVTFLGWTGTPGLVVNSNGYIQWSNGQAFADNAAIPAVGTAPPNSVCGFWDNLSPQLSPNSIRQQTLGVAPARRMVVQWTAVPTITGGIVTFQITIFETPVPGVPNPIRLQYLTLTGAGSDGSSATVGINGLNNGLGIQYLFNGQPAGNLLTPSLAIGFYPVGQAAAPWAVTPAQAAPVPGAGANGPRIDKHEDYDSTVDEFRAENCSAGAASSSAWLLIACAFAMGAGVVMRPRAT